MGYSPVVIPPAFRSQRALKIFNVVAVGAALAAATSAIFAAMLGGDPGHTAIMTAFPTLVVGTAWALLLRWPRTMRHSTIRVGWIASVPLAMLNAAGAASMIFASPFRGHASFADMLGGAFLGATVGAIFWIPALLATLFCFGLPIAHAQRLAEKGLAGEERGELTVGLASLAVAFTGFMLSFPAAGRIPLMEPTGVWLTRFLGLVGMFAGGAAAYFARARAARRRAFVGEVESGRVAGYRIDETDEGKVLVRVVSQGQGYRVADFEEELYELDDAGEAMRPKQVMSLEGH